MKTSPAGPTYNARGEASSAQAMSATAGSARGRRRLGLIGAAVAVLMLIVGLFAGLVPSASAAGAQVNQCNGVYNTGGQAVECHVIINNVLNLATGVSRSSGTIEECHGAAGAAPLCTTTPVVALSTVVNQCNGSALGGGATLKCSVLITNTITGNGSKSPATVNQCIGSGKGGGAEPTTACSPVASTTNADITQCNGSANGGGAQRRVKCTVNPSTVTGALPITINQCNGSAAAGSLVTCTSQIVNNFVTVPPPTTTATATSTTGPTTSATGPTTGPTRPRPSGTVRPTIATRPTTSASVTTTARTTGNSTSGRVTATTSGGGTNTTAARSTSSTTSTNGVATGSTTSSSTTTTSLASTGVPAARQALLAFALFSAGVGLMLVGRRPRWIGKHR